MALNPVGSGASIALTTDTANTTSSIAQKANTLRVVLVGADAVQGAHVAIGTDASATTSDFYVVKNEPASINIFRPSSQKVVGITTGATTLIDFPEGTGSPFAVGSRVDLTVTGQSYYDDVVGFATVSKVWSGSGRNGYFSTRITVDADTSGIVTAYSSDNYAELRNSFKVSALAKGGAVTGKSTLYYQQVQISGEG
tara:strand:- start:278 stop:868 length:591 start_codon:yes stop_codon:yes gene_type:complete